MQSLYDKLAELSRENRRAVLCTIIQTQGSTPRKAGTKMIVLSDGCIYGTIGGGEFEEKIREEALLIMKGSPPLVVEFDLSQDLTMTCGGKATVFLEPLQTDFPLFIFGGGHVGRAVAGLALDLGFSVSILDDREAVVDEKLAKVCRYMIGDYLDSLQNIPFDERTFIVITTSSHQTDELILAGCIKKPCAYLGMIGSRSKAAGFRSRFIEKHLASPEELDKVNMPIGIPFHAETPREIAISILAKMIDTKNNLT